MGKLPGNCNPSCPLLDPEKGCVANQTTYCSLAHTIWQSDHHPRNCAGIMCSNRSLSVGCLANQTIYCSHAQLLGA